MADQIINFLLAQIATLTVLGAIGLLFREALAKWFGAKISHGFNEKIERLKAELALRGKEVETLRAGAQAALTARQSILEKRRLEAVDQLWAAQKKLQSGRGIVSSISVLRWEAIADAAERSEKVRQMFGALGKAFDPKTLQENEAHASRPYVTPLAWALFHLYALIVSFAHARFLIIEAGVGKDALNPDSSVFDAVAAALPGFDELFKTSGTLALPMALEELEKRLLAELQSQFVRQDDDREHVERAARILSLAQEAEAKLRNGLYDKALKEIKEN